MLVVLALNQLWLNLEFSMGRIGQDFSFDFLESRAGFEIKEGIEYTSNDSYLRAFVVGLVNTIRIAVVGIVLATVLGLVIGVGRLSTNWLVRRTTQVYVEFFRNTPLLIQIIFWYVAVILTLPRIENAPSLFGITFFSNRGVVIPWFETQDVGPFWIGLLVALAATIAVRRWRARVNERTGEPSHGFLWGAGTFLVIAVIAYVATGAPVTIDTPSEIGRGAVGGLELSGELSALLLGLVVYTSAFIGEIIRGSILAVSKGQKEAAEALGLRPGQQLRLVVLPQALRIAIPPINSQYLNLTKNTTLAFAIAYPELAYVSSVIINQAGRSFQVIAMLMGSFLILSLVISFLMNMLNRAVALKGAR